MAKKIFGPVDPGEDWHRHAVVEHRGEHALAMGFAATGDLIVERWVHRGPNDLLFEPLLFNYRHALELILKAAIRDASGLLRRSGDTDPQLVPTTLNAWFVEEARHNLHKLSTRLAKLLKRLDSEDLPADTYQVLMALHELDRGGDTFRYSYTKNKAGQFVPATRPLLDARSGRVQAHVDIVAMHERFKDAFTLLSGGVMTVLQNIADYLDDLAREADW